MKPENSYHTAGDDAFLRGYHNIPDDEKLRQMSLVELADLLSSCEKGSAKYTVVEQEIICRQNSDFQSKEEKKWYERPIGQIGIGISIAVLTACAIYIVKDYTGLPL